MGKKKRKEKKKERKENQTGMQERVARNSKPAAGLCQVNRADPNYSYQTVSKYS